MMIFDELINIQVKEMAPSGIRKFFDIASSKKGVISLGVGEPDFITPYHIREAAMHAIHTGKTFYTANKGLLELRQEICNYYLRRFNLSYNPNNECMITVGGSEAIDIVLRAILNEGDEVILPTPSYVAYAPIIQLSKGKVVEVTMTEENGFKLKKDQLKKAISDKTKAIVINFPSNPTGGIMEYDDYLEIADLIKENNILVISDEIYAELTYDKKHVSIANIEQLKENTIIINGFSKAYSMTGYRVGYILAEKPLIEMFNKIHQYTIMCASTPSQFAAIEAAKNGDKDIEEMYLSFKQRRNYIVKELNRIGLRTHLPEGAFYVFPSIKSTNMTSNEFCETLLDKENLALVPGSAFGADGEGYVRISYAYSLEEIKQAIERLERFLKSL
jgi:aminotransferase